MDSFMQWCEEVWCKFQDDMNQIERKMHRYPACLRGSVDICYTKPRVVAIGPYHQVHHHQNHLNQAEKVKHVAAKLCASQSGRSLDHLYFAVAPAADAARRDRLYDEDVMADIGTEDFRRMMLLDACFLVQFMLMLCHHRATDESLQGFFGPNRRDIRHDVMLLENQLPWNVVEAVMSFTPVPMDRLISVLKLFLQDQNRGVRTNDDADPEGHYEPPHLLGLLRYHAVGRRGQNVTEVARTKNLSISISAMELAEIGVSLTPDDNRTGLIHMGLHEEGTLFAKLSLVPVSLDHNRASFLVNMAALELCTVKTFTRSAAEDSAVCSYLLLLAMLVSRTEDVHELRVRGLLQGGGGLTNKQALRFFTSLQGLRRGNRYIKVMRDIVRYKEDKSTRTKLYMFFYNNWKTITALASAAGTLGGIFGTLLSIRKALS